MIALPDAIPLMPAIRLDDRRSERDFADREMSVGEVGVLPTACR